MRYIWKPGTQMKMHIQAHNHMGEGLTGGLCGITFPDGWRTINAPFGLGKGLCKHCKAAADGQRQLPSWLTPTNTTEGERDG